MTGQKLTEQDSKEQSEELSWINTIIMLGNETTSLEMFVEKTFQFIFPLLNFSGGGIYLFDPSTQINTLTYHKNIHHEFLELGMEVKMTEDPSSKFQKKKLHICKDASIEYGAENTKKWNLSSYIGIPIIARDEYKGNLNLFTSQPRTFQIREINFFKSIGRQIGIIFKKFESENELKEKNMELSALNRIIALGDESRSLQEFLEKSYDQILDIVGFDRGGVYLYNPETQHNKLVLHKNVHTDFIAAVEDVDISEGLFAQVFDKNNPYYIEDFSEFIANSKELGVYSAAIIPLRSKDKYVGSLNIGSPVHQTLSQNELELLVAIGKQMGSIIQKFESEKLLKESEEKYRKAYYQANLYRDIFAHDINNILQNISSSAELSSLYLNNPEKLHTLKELYEIINEQVNRGKKLIINVRKITEIDESEIILEKIDANRLLRNAIEFLHNSFQTRNINIQLNTPTKNLYVMANNLLLDVFENILINAVRYNDKSKIEIIIDISKEEKDEKEFIKMEFKDNGIGISDYRKNTIFERGSRKRYKSKGMGLGLSLVRKIIDTYNSDIWVEDRVNGDYKQGSNFVVLIPFNH